MNVREFAFESLTFNCSEYANPFKYLGDNEVIQYPKNRIINHSIQDHVNMVCGTNRHSMSIREFVGTMGILNRIEYMLLFRGKIYLKYFDRLSLTESILKEL